MGGSAAGTAGGLVDVAGLAAAPFTGGASLLPAALTAGAIGAGASLVGGGGSAPAGSGGSGFPQNTPGGAYAYTPQFQPQQDWMLNQLLSGQGGSVLGQAFTDQQPTSQLYWNQALPQSQAGFNLVNGPQSFAGQLPGNVLNNPYYQQAQTGADTAAYNTLQAAYGGYGTGQSTILGNLNQALGTSQPTQMDIAGQLQQIAQNLQASGQGIQGYAPFSANLANQTAGLGAGVGGYAGQAGAGIGPTQAFGANALTGLPLINALASQQGSGAGQLSPMIQDIMAQAAVTSGLGPPTSALGGQIAQTLPQYQAGANQIAGLAPGLSGPIGALNQASGQLLQTGMDPRSALYNRTAQQVLDQQRAVNAMSGVGTSPYGAGVTGQTMSNFNIDWQNQQLQRQAQALSGAAGGYGQAGALTGEQASLQGQALAALTGMGGQAGAAGGLFNQAAGIGGQAANQVAQAGGLAGAQGGLLGQAAQTYGLGQNVLGQGANAYSQAAQQAQTAGGLLGSIGGLNQQAAAQQALSAGLYGQGAQLAAGAQSPLAAASGIYGGLPGLNQGYTGAYGTLGQQIAQSAAQPGQTYLQQQQATQNALNTYLSQLGQSQGLTTGASNIGQAQYNEPNQLLTAMESYLTGGRNAAQLAGNLGQLGTNQATQGLAGLTNLGVLGSNALFGSNSPFAAGGGTGGGLVGALGGFGGNVNPTGLTTIDPATGIQDFSGGTVPSSGLLGWLQGLGSSGA